MDCQFALLALIGSEKESNDLCAGAAIVRSEQAITNAVGHAIYHGPRHGLGVPRVGGHIREAAQRLGLRGAGGPPQEGDDLGPGAEPAGAKQAAAHSTAP